MARHDNTGKSAWAFDPVVNDWRRVTITGPDQGQAGWPLTPVRFPDGRSMMLGPLAIVFSDPAGWNMASTGHDMAG